MADNRANGSIKCSERVYDAAGVDACIEEASRKEAANRNAMIKAKLSLFEQEVVIQRIQDLRDELLDSEGVAKTGINYKGNINAQSDLQYVVSPAHGDLYISESENKGYIYTVVRTKNPETGAVETTTKWAELICPFDLSNYYNKDQVWPASRTQALADITNNLNARLSASVAKLETLKTKNRLQNDENLSLHDVNSLVGDILEALKEAVNSFSV